ncbi:unnamed protein product [Auanema sp. JU1783]|nr:unnamed protein product [Auanema sp. JU1783]
MAKNMENTSYRRLNVDEFDPEKYDENEEGSQTPGLGPDEKTINSMLSTNRFNDALHAVLMNPPLKTENMEQKEKAVRLVAKVVGSFKSSEVEAVVKTLNDDEADVLMKYIFKAMEIVPDSALCQTLLTWHAQMVSRFGLGSIIRVFSDRNRL